MEQLGPKGMRMFITDSVRTSLDSSNQDWVIEKQGFVDIHGAGKEAYYHFNWLLNPPLGGTVQMGRYTENAASLASTGSINQKIVGSSILEMTGHDRFKKLIY